MESRECGTKRDSRLGRGGAAKDIEETESAAHYKKAAEKAPRSPSNGSFRESEERREPMEGGADERWRS